MLPAPSRRSSKNPGSNSLVRCAIDTRCCWGSVRGLANTSQEDRDLEHENGSMLESNREDFEKVCLVPAQPRVFIGYDKDRGTPGAR